MPPPETAVTLSFCARKSERLEKYTPLMSRRQPSHTPENASKKQTYLQEPG